MAKDLIDSGSRIRPHVERIIEQGFTTWPLALDEKCVEELLSGPPTDASSSSFYDGTLGSKNDSHGDSSTSRCFGSALPPRSGLGQGPLLKALYPKKAVRSPSVHPLRPLFGAI